MEMAFSRGLYTGWFHGMNNQELVHGRFGKKRGVYLGEIAEVRRDGVVLASKVPSSRAMACVRCGQAGGEGRRRAGL